MSFTISEIRALTTFQPLTHDQLKDRERSGGFSATLEELARADATDEKPEGPEWWLNKILSPLKSQQPPAGEYQLAKAENGARRGLGMAPNADTLFTQYFEEELQKAGSAPTPEQIQAIRERVQERVEAEVKAWYEQQQENQKDLRLQEQMTEFEMLQQRIKQQLDEPGVTETSQTSSDREKLFTNLIALQMNRLPAAEMDADTLLKQIKRAQLESVSLQQKS